MQKDILENFQKMTQLTNAILEKAAQNAEVASEAKDFKDVAAWQAEWAQECTQKIVESSRSCADIVAEAGKVYTSLFEAGLKSASNASAKTGGKARKAA